MVTTPKGGQTGRDESDVVDRRLVAPLEPPQQPPRRHSRVTLRRLESDQRSQLEKFAERWPAELAQHSFGDEQVAALDRPMEDRSWMTLRCDPALRSGAGRHLAPEPKL